MADANHNERWLPVVGWEGMYEVSDLGRVRSLDRKVPHRTSGYITIRGRVLTPGSHKSGHQHVNLCLHDKSHTRKVHRLVVESFIGPIGDGLQVLHWNDDASDNRLENLRIGTFSDNAFDKVRNGRHHQAVKTHCPQGHPYDEGNTMVIPSRPTARYCRACQKVHKARYEARQRRGE